MPESNILRAYSVRASDDAGKPGDSIRFVASTSDVARDGFIVDAKGWELDNFRRNPVMQWAHSYNEPPIGKITNVEIVDDKLMADVVFDQNDEFARKIESKYRAGYLSAVSVGFDIVTMEPGKGDQPMRVTKAELLELSAVPVPADPGALSQLQGRAYRKIGQELLDAIPDDVDDEAEIQRKTAEKIVASVSDSTKQITVRGPDSLITEFQRFKADTSARMSWEDTAAAMVDLFRPYSQRPDAERTTEHQRLEREYARHKKTAPEFKTNAELDAFAADDIRGLFLAGEPELYPETFALMHSRAGAVFSKRNLDTLDQAITLLGELRERAIKEADDAAKSDDERQTQAALEQVAAMLKGSDK